MSCVTPPWHSALTTNTTSLPPQPLSWPLTGPPAHSAPSRSPIWASSLLPFAPSYSSHAYFGPSKSFQILLSYHPTLPSVIGQGPPRMHSPFSHLGTASSPAGWPQGISNVAADPAGHALHSEHPTRQTHQVLHPLSHHPQPHVHPISQGYRFYLQINYLSGTIISFPDGWLSQRPNQAPSSHKNPSKNVNVVIRFPA